METIEALFNMKGISAIGVVIILGALATCVVTCTYVVVDTARDTIRQVRSLRKNKKTKN